MTPASSSKLILVAGEGSTVIDSEGRSWTDLEMGFGAAFLGHAHPAIAVEIASQARTLTSCGRHSTDRTARVEELIGELLPPDLVTCGLYSTGMEAVEFALRIAASVTGRRRFAGFSRSMHGKSALTASICWANAPVPVGNAERLPFVDETDEAAILEAVETLLARRAIAGLLVEAIQGSNAAHEASPGFYRRVAEICAETGTLLIFDETLTGIHRGGGRFQIVRLDVRPDILLFAKCLGNGFPVSSIAVGPRVRIGPEALPGSTFSANPMALAAVEATLRAMRAMPMASLVAGIESVVRSFADSLAACGAVLRGRGALWCIDLGDHARSLRTQELLHERRILISRSGNGLRLIPAATIDADQLRRACSIVADACAATCDRRRMESIHGP